MQIGISKGFHKEAIMYRLEMLPAKQGDCLWIEYGSAKSPSRVLIDGGVIGTYEALKSKIEALPIAKRVFELVVVTHIDRDHIEGLIKLLNDDSLKLKIKEIWYNGWEHVAQADRLGALQGEFLAAIIQDKGIAWNTAFDEKAVVVGDDLPVHTLPGGLEITLLSPTVNGLASLRSLWQSEVEEKGIDPGDAEAALEHMYEHRKEFLPADLLGLPKKLNVEELADSKFSGDKSKANGSSIAFIAAYDGKSCLLAGDAHAPVTQKSIESLLERSRKSRLSVDAFKISHHGGKTNLSADLLKVLECPRYLISTDGSHFNHPHPESVARILHHGGARPELCFNYTSAVNQVWDDVKVRKQYEYKTLYPKAGQKGLRIDL
jgi:hypothetical protein